MPCLCRKCFAYYSVLPKAGVCLLNQEKLGRIFIQAKKGFKTKPKKQLAAEPILNEHVLNMISH